MNALLTHNDSIDQNRDNVLKKCDTVHEVPSLQHNPAIIAISPTSSTWLKLILTEAVEIERTVLD